jgi:DNA-directed RNA polymerase subunit K
MIEHLDEQFTKYELARILGARALQIAMDAPLLLKIDEKELEEINYNPIEIAKRELVAGVLPITVNKPLPRKKEAKIRKLSKEELEEIKKKETSIEESKEKNIQKDDVKLEAEEDKAEKEVSEDAEIMELATPDDEVEETSESSAEEA